MRGIIKRGVSVFLLLLTVIIFQGVALADEINIGFSGPLTGPAAFIGIDSLHGAQICAKEINDAGGVVVAGKKYNVVIRSYDDEGVGAKAVAGMQKLKDRYNIAVLNQNISGSVAACVEQNEKIGVLIIGYFKHPTITNRGNKLLLRQEITAAEEARYTVEGTVKILKPKTYAMLLDVGDYGKGYHAVYKEQFEKMGVKLVATEWLDMRTQTDFRGQLTTIRAANPDVIMIVAYDEATAGAIKQAHELNIKTPFVTATGFQDMGIKLTGPKLIEGYLKPFAYHSVYPPPLAVARYRNELYPKMGWKEPAGPYGLGVYQQMHTIIKAMQIAETTTDAMKIRQAVPKTVPMDEKYNTMAVSGWKDNGDAICRYFMGRFKDGRAVLVE